MSKQTVHLPHEIDPFRLAETRAHLEGEVPVKQFNRLKPLLNVDSGSVSISLDFDKDELGVPVVKGKLKTVLALNCQRCLERLDYPMELDVSLAWVRTDQEAADLPLQQEPYLVESTPLRLNDVLEDEILLALPNIAMHDLKECQASQYISNDKQSPEAQETDSNPFAVLAKLKTDE